jgi:hypothetical protein
VARLGLPLSPAQARLLTFLARDSAWHDRHELEHIKLLEAGDANEVDPMAEAGLVVVSDNLVRISPAGATKAEQEGGHVVSDTEQLRTFLAAGPFFHGPAGE